MIQFIAVIGIILVFYILFKQTYEEIKNYNNKTSKVDEFKSTYGENWASQFESMLEKNDWLNK